MCIESVYNTHVPGRTRRRSQSWNKYASTRPRVYTMPRYTRIIHSGPWCTYNTEFANRAFSSTAPRIWNSLPSPFGQRHLSTPSDDTWKLICSPATPRLTNCYQPRLRFESCLTSAVYLLAYLLITDDPRGATCGRHNNINISTTHHLPVTVLAKYVRPVPTYYAAVCPVMRTRALHCATMTLTLDFLRYTAMPSDTGGSGTEKTVLITRCNTALQTTLL